MKKFFLILIVLAVCGFVYAQPKIIVERPAPKADTTQAVMDTSAVQRFVLDPAAMAYQMQVDSVNKAAEDKIRSLIISLEHKFEDPKVEEDVGRLIGTAVMEQQMALLDLQVDRAISLRDTILLVGLETALRELVQNNSTVRTELIKALDRLEAEMHAK